MLNYTFSRLFSNRWSEMTENNFEFSRDCAYAVGKQEFCGFFCLFGRCLVLLICGTFGGERKFRDNFRQKFYTICYFIFLYAK